MKKCTGISTWVFVCLAVFLFPMTAWAGSLQTVTEEAQVKQIPDGSGRYILKSDGFYCLKEDASADNTASVHYFDHFVIDGTVFDGYYYHDASGKFCAGTPYMAYLKQVKVFDSTAEDGTAATYVIDGYYMINNLGRLTAAPQIRYMDELKLNGKEFDGYFYFDGMGRMSTEAGIHFVEMDSNGRGFDGYYYFGENGELASEGGTTPEGYVYDDEGKIENAEQTGIRRLQSELSDMVSGFEGQWSLYVKDLDDGQEILLNNRKMTSASLIKAFVMAKTYADMENVEENQLSRQSTTSEDEAVKKISTLLTNMITVSDNESFNELVRLQTGTYDFSTGARKINSYLEEEGYKDTEVLHTLSPAATSPTGIGENNTTSVKDCGLLLERIYEGECVNQEASDEMLSLLLRQQNHTKIPQPLAADLEIANKTGETDTSQHDIAIVYGEKTTYILCVMSEDCPKEENAIEDIRSISAMVYEYLNSGEMF